MRASASARWLHDSLAHRLTPCARVVRPTSQAGVISEQLDENMGKEKKLLGRTDVSVKHNLVLL
jgi:hypothetical protein